MLVGYALGVQHLTSFAVDPAVIASVIVLGALAASSIEAPMAAGVALVAVFGACHGFAHGSEAPAGAGIGFPIGFATSTVALHGLGLALGLAALKVQRPHLLRLLGGGVALGGVILAFAG
jgi:urease accessory protein